MNCSKKYIIITLVSDIYHITRERVVDIYDTCPIEMITHTTLLCEFYFYRTFSIIDMRFLIYERKINK